MEAYNLGQGRQILQMEGRPDQPWQALMVCFFMESNKIVFLLSLMSFSVVRYVQT